MEKRTGSALATEVEGKDTLVKQVEKAAVAPAVAPAVAAAVVAEALAVHTETVEVVEKKDAQNRSMQQRVCYACGALLRREQTGTCSRTGIGQPA